MPQTCKITDDIELSLIDSRQFKRGCTLTLSYKINSTPKLTVEEFCKLLNSNHLDAILNYEKEVYNSLQIILTSDSEKIEPNGNTVKDEFNIVGDRVYKCERNYKKKS